jgi:catechol 2,3-dioxygenase-like lactoylglutathione lyase family enzyme
METGIVSDKWWTRPILSVTDINISADFYVKQLGFTEPWRYEEEGKALVAEVDRKECQLILSSQWPDKVGKGLIFVSIFSDEIHTLRAEFEGKRVEVKDGFWGYPIMIIKDPDGNEIYFQVP